MAGHIKLDRKILSWEWYQDINTCRLFIHLLLKANWQDGKWQGIAIKRGQFITGLDKLSISTGLSVQQLRTAFSKLKLTGEITIKSTNRFRVITICKYDTYQSQRSEDNKQNNIQTEDEITDNQQTVNKQSTASNKYKNNKEEKEDIGEPEKKAFSMEVLYQKTWDEYRGILNGQAKLLSEEIFNEWKSFVDFVNEKGFTDLFDCKFITPIDWGKMKKDCSFPKSQWLPILKKILSTGVKPEHNLYFRIPEFIGYANKEKNDIPVDTKQKLVFK